MLKAKILLSGGLPTAISCKLQFQLEQAHKCAWCYNAHTSVHMCVCAHVHGRVRVHECFPHATNPCFLGLGGTQLAEQDSTLRLPPGPASQSLHTEGHPDPGLTLLAGIGKAPPPSPWPICTWLGVPVAYFTAAQPHVRALGLAHRHPLARLDRVDPNL